MKIPLPPFELRQLVGPTEDRYFDNPSGRAIFVDVPEENYKTVFDFGSGCGRLARQLMQQSVRPSAYTGVDLHKGMVQWCERNLTPHDPRFRFIHQNVFNAGFNPDPQAPRVSEFPVEEGYASLMIAWSVFTHTTQEQTEFYIKEAARILDERGILLATWFLFEKRYFPMMQDFQNTLYINDVDPSNATIFDREWLQDVLSDAGLDISKATPPSIRGFQWETQISKKGKRAKVLLAEDRAPFGRNAPPVVSSDPSKLGLDATDG